jgi:hypothetical protein
MRLRAASYFGRSLRPDHRKTELERENQRSVDRACVLSYLFERRLYLNPVRAKAIPPMNRITPDEKQALGAPEGQDEGQCAGEEPGYDEDEPKDRQHGLLHDLA